MTDRREGANSTKVAGLFFEYMIKELVCMQIPRQCWPNSRTLERKYRESVQFLTLNNKTHSKCGARCTGSRKLVVAPLRCPKVEDVSCESVPIE